jgi:hypothetical protein
MSSSVINQMRRNIVSQYGHPRLFFHHPSRQFRSGLGSGFFERVSDGVFHCAARNKKPCGYFRVRQTLGGQGGDFTLSL